MTSAQLLLNVFFLNMSENIFPQNRSSDLLQGSSMSRSTGCDRHNSDPSIRARIERQMGIIYFCMVIPSPLAAALPFPARCYKCYDCSCQTYHRCRQGNYFAYPVSSFDLNISRQPMREKIDKGRCRNNKERKNYDGTFLHLPPPAARSSGRMY